MDEFKPEDELKPDPSDRRTGRSRQSSERSERTERGEPQINLLNLMTLTIAVRLVRKKSAMMSRKSKKKLTNPKMKSWMKSA